MIVLHKMNGDEIILNANHIETIESKPDTTITLVNDKKYLVKESRDEVLSLIYDYFHKVLTGKT
ncbi:MAG: flagellar FlbD family protein [Spirochaetes bacterium]|nr:flagellar FlbD family protein [Spirochaetota bacterium]HQL43870.1 flagellar FlbD family protein [Spirochaetota bacterium]